MPLFRYAISRYAIDDAVDAMRGALAAIFFAPCAADARYTRYFSFD